MSTPPRLLVTGSRDWDDEDTIEGALFLAYMELGGRRTGVVLVHGACATGADLIAERIWRKYAPTLTIERHPADWAQHGRRAGFVRNVEMVTLGAELCLAFIRDRSRGATHTADLAEHDGIEVRRFVATSYPQNQG